MKIDNEEMVIVLVQSIFAASALIGLVSHSGMKSDFIIRDSWEYGDRMAAEFIRRAKATFSKGT